MHWAYGPRTKMAAIICYVFKVFVIWEYILFRQAYAIQDKCPSSCSCLGNLVDCSKQGLISVPKDLPFWVTRLELQYNGITSISEDDFKGLPNLTQLDLSNNQIRLLNETAFQQLASLESLKINHNQLVEVPKLKGLTNLRTMELNQNNIQTLAMEFLAHMPQLKVLEMNHNGLTDIMPGVFPANNTLSKLTLNNNNLESFERGCLDNLTSLETLKMNKNKISEIAIDLFSKLRNLVSLEMSKNRLVEIKGLTFENLKKLHLLKLKKNMISEFKDGAFWGLEKLHTLQLDHNNISKIQLWLFGVESLREITLSHNKISSINSRAWEYSEQIDVIDLTSNRLVTINTESFRELRTLRKLYLNNNQILNIQDGAFRDLQQLEELELNNNQISWTIEDKNGAFVGLETLQRLGLESNKIKSITQNAFDGLRSVRILNMKNNDITSIQSNAFEPMTNLKQLQLNTSSLLCDCQLAWLPQWLLVKEFHNSVVANCAHPPNLRGKSIFIIKPELFKCEGDYMKPVMTVHPSSLIALKGENITLTCEAVSTEESRTEFSWKKDNMLLINPMVENIKKSEKMEDGQMMINYTSRLHLLDIQDGAAGNYQCVISNEFGSAYSHKADISIHVYPEFIKTPVDITVKAGTTARLECSARGLPTPTIAWKKDGGDNFPAARDRRMHVMPADEIFFIVEVQPNDEGVYSCTARNSEGVISVNATLTVLQTPSFVRPMVRHKYVTEGDNEVIQCMADGSPRPKLTWYKDGKVLVPIHRHFMAAENQLLIIVQTQRSDSGKYMCKLENNLGTVSGTTELTIVPSKSVNGGSSHGSRSLPGDQTDESTTTGIIIIAVVCCVVGTSLVWVIIIYQTRKRHEMYSATPTDETTLPGEIPSSGYASTDKEGSYSQPVTMVPSSYQQYQEYQMKESGYESSSGRFRAARAAAIFPSDVDEEESKQSMPLTLGEHHLGSHSPDNSISYPDSETDSLKSSHSTSSTHTSGHQTFPLAGGQHTLRTFHPILNDTVSVTKCLEQIQCENCEKNRTAKSDMHQCHSLNRHSSMNGPHQNGLTYTGVHHGSQPQPPGGSVTDLPLRECVCDSPKELACSACHSRMSYKPSMRLASNNMNLCNFHKTASSSSPHITSGPCCVCHNNSSVNTSCDSRVRTSPYCVSSDGHASRDGNHSLRRNTSTEKIPPVIPPKQHKHLHRHANKCSLQIHGPQDV